MLSTNGSRNTFIKEKKTRTNQIIVHHPCFSFYKLEYYSSSTLCDLVQMLPHRHHDYIVVQGQLLLIVPMRTTYQWISSKIFPIVEDKSRSTLKLSLDNELESKHCQDRPPRRTEESASFVGKSRIASGSHYDTSAFIIWRSGFLILR